MNYKIYERNKKINQGYKRVLFEKKGLAAYLEFQQNWFYHKRPDEDFYLGHLQFYALSEGWREFTETGYKSQFFNSSEDGYSDDDIKKLFLDYLDSLGFKFPEVVQMGLF